MARPRQSETTRKRLLEQGVAAFLENGYHGTGIKEVLDRVKVPKGSFYNYFENKEAFAAATVRHYSGCFAEKMKQALKGAPDPLTGLKRFFESLMVEFEASGFIGGCLIANLGAELEGSDVCREALSEGFHGWSKDVAKVLQQGQQLGLIRSDIEANELADLLTEAWEGAVIRMKIERSLAPLYRVLHRLLDDYLRA